MMLVRKLLKENLSIGQLLGYALSGLLGLSIVLIGLQFYLDTKPAFSSNESFLKKDFLVISKQVSLLKTIGTSSTEFRDSEIEDLKKQPFVSKVGFFTPSTFNVELRTDGSGGLMGFSTDLFFEAIPDEFLDITSADWGWSEGSEFIPIIIPRTYLHLYNFGFAQSKGYPQISENIIEKIAMIVSIGDWRNSARFKARIVGFSNKINTILVPLTFISWANQNYGSGNANGVSRLLVEVKNPTDPAITQYIADKGYEFNDDKLDAGKGAYFVRIITVIILSIGVVISLLAVGLLMLSMSLLIHKNKSKLENLMLIGYNQQAIAAPYQRLALLITVSVFVVALAVTFIVRGIYLSKFEMLGFGATSNAPYFIIGITILLLICVANYFWIKAKVNAVFKPRK
ncbi:MAG: ABC transporter permease [Prevotellaceae bacterium]|jgi:hypothetical protein|nr:ABC transporter permease [Prevotellaceae bacterium]